MATLSPEAFLDENAAEVNQERVDVFLHKSQDTCPSSLIEASETLEYDGKLGKGTRKDLTF